MQGSGLRVQGSGFRVFEGSEFRVQGAGSFRVQGSGSSQREKKRVGKG